VIYDYPKYYEIAFSFRDIPKETAFFETCIDRFSVVKVRRVLEIACGLAPHAGELARLGYGYLGLDNNSNMLDSAKHNWRELDPQPEFINGDMVSFETPNKIDFAYVMLGSLYLNTQAEMHSHFDSIADALHPGGLYLLDWCIQFDDPMNYANNNAVTHERDGIKIESRFDIRLLDKEQQMYEEIWTLDIDDHGKQQQLKRTEHNRAVFPAEFLEFVKSRTDFEFIGWWRDWDLSQPITNNCQIIRPVTLLRRK
jgi:SAM-dependent methyltransferase